MKGIWIVAAVLTLCAASHDVQAQALGDPIEGLAIAKEVCSQCHAVQKQETRSPNSRSPTFGVLAASAVPGLTSPICWTRQNRAEERSDHRLLLPDRSLARPLFSAAWVVEACRVHVSTRGVDGASTGLADGADGILGAVGAAVR